MLRLTAQYADLWNSGYFGHPEQFVKPRQELEEACQAVGRDPSTLGVTAMLALHFYDLAPIQPDFDYPPLGGTPEEIAQAMLGYHQAGVQHIMFHLVPYNLTAISRLEEALRIYRQMISN